MRAACINIPMDYTDNEDRAYAQEQMALWRLWKDSKKKVTRSGSGCLKEGVTCLKCKKEYFRAVSLLGRAVSKGRRAQLCQPCYDQVNKLAWYHRKKVANANS